MPERSLTPVLDGYSYDEIARGLLHAAAAIAEADADPRTGVDAAGRAIRMIAEACGDAPDRISGRVGEIGLRGVVTELADGLETERAIAHDAESGRPPVFPPIARGDPGLVLTDALARIYSAGYAAADPRALGHDVLARRRHADDAIARANRVLGIAVPLLAEPRIVGAPSPLAGFTDVQIVRGALRAVWRLLDHGGTSMGRTPDARAVEEAMHLFGDLPDTLADRMDSVGVFAFLAEAKNALERGPYAAAVRAPGLPDWVKPDQQATGLVTAALLATHDAGALTADPEWRRTPGPSKPVVNRAEWVNIHREMANRAIETLRATLGVAVEGTLRLVPASVLPPQHPSAGL